MKREQNSRYASHKGLGIQATNCLGRSGGQNSEGNFDFLDNFENKIQGKQKLFPSGTVLAGKRVARA